MKKLIKYITLYFLLVPSFIFACRRDVNHVITIDTEKHLEKLLKNHQGPSVVYFYMDKCGWCKKMGPLFDELSDNAMFDHITFYKANGPHLQAATHCKKILDINIVGYPYMIFMNKGKVVDKQIGGTKKEILMEKLQALQAKKEKHTKHKHSKK